MKMKEVIYIVDYMRHTISAYTLSGKYLFEFGGLGTSLGWFYYPMDITLDGQGNILIVDTFNQRVQIIKVKRSWIMKLKKPQ